MARIIRIISQIFFFIMFCISLLLLANENLVHKFHVEWFLQLNPLTAILSSIASRSILIPIFTIGMIVAILTMFFGRIFCGYVCPLGALIDFSDRYITEKMRTASRRPPLYLRRLKYVLLLLLITCSIVGIFFPIFMDPISILTRIMTLIVIPVLNFSGYSIKSLYLSFNSNAVANSAGTSLLPTSLLTAAVLLAIIAGGFWDRRFWCQYICPSGAFFAILSRFSFFRRKVNSSTCNNCRLCSSRQCPTRAINFTDNTITSVSECLLCGRCTNNTRSCSKLTFTLPDKKTTTGINLERRHLLAGITAGIAAAPLIKTGYLTEGIEPELIRPPGSIAEKDFLTRCIACSECMKVCPNHVLGPCGFSDELKRIGTPKLFTKNSFCRDNCTACSQVCPTRAIIPISLNDKPFIKIGTAIIDSSRCLSWRGTRRCMVCYNICPYHAITLKQIDDHFVPVVDSDLCTGCGKCEKYCPVSTKPAIQIISDGERRIRSGIAVINEKRRKKIVEIRERNAKEKQL